MSKPNAYDCEQAFRHLGDYLDRELTADEIEKIEEHLHTCEECAHEFKFEDELLACLKAKARLAKVPEGFRESILKALDQVEHNRDA